MSKNSSEKMPDLPDLPELDDSAETADVLDPDAHKRPGFLDQRTKGGYRAQDYRSQKKEPPGEVFFLFFR